MPTATAVATITRKELRFRMDHAEPCVLIETLPEDEYRRGHLPGAFNVPPDRVTDMVPEMVPDRSEEIVVYGADEASPAARDAAQELEALGYLNVRAYEGGKKDWVEHGFPLQGETTKI